MVERTRQQGCCSSSDCPTNFGERVELGRRRLRFLRRVAAGCSVVTCVAALVSLLPVVSIDDATADRMAWGATVWGLPRLLRYARAALVARKVTAPLLMAVTLVVIAALGLPIVTAVVVAVVLVSDLVRQPSGSVVVGADQVQRA